MVQKKTITIVGTVKGQENEQQSFRVFAGSADPSDESRVGVIYNSLAHTITLEQPFLDAKIFIDGKNAPAFNAKVVKQFQFRLSGQIIFLCLLVMSK